MQPLSNKHIKIIDFKRVIKELASFPVFFINISGGEPFIHPEITDILQIAHKNFKHVMVLSNGTYINSNDLSTIAKIIESKVRLSRI